MGEMTRERTSGSRPIANTRTFNLDHFCTDISHKLGGIGCRNHLTQLNNSKARQCSRHVDPADATAAPALKLREGYHGTRARSSVIAVPNLGVVLPPANKRHLGCHNRQKLDIRIEWQISHVDNDLGYVADVEDWLGRNHAAGLGYSLFHSLG
jgi:hypothetical protein